jgi:integrase
VSIHLVELSSRRTVGLPQRAVSALKSYRKRQLVEKLAAGPLYQDEGLVFASGHGTPIDAQSVVNRYYKPLLKRASLPPIRFHDLRHSCLSLLAQRGEPIRDLQALAGHATAAFTLHNVTPTITTPLLAAPLTRWARSSPTNLADATGNAWATTVFGRLPGGRKSSETARIR